MYLQTFCVLSGNTEYFGEKARPILYGIAVEVHGGYCFPAKFMYRVTIITILLLYLESTFYVFNSFLGAGNSP